MRFVGYSRIKWSILISLVARRNNLLIQRGAAEKMTIEAMFGNLFHFISNGTFFCLFLKKFFVFSENSKKFTITTKIFQLKLTNQTKVIISGSCGN